MIFGCVTRSTINYTLLAKYFRMIFGVRARTHTHPDTIHFRWIRSTPPADARNVDWKTYTEKAATHRFECVFTSWLVPSCHSFFYAHSVLFCAPHNQQCSMPIDCICTTARNTRLSNEISQNASCIYFDFYTRTHTLAATRPALTIGARTYYDLFVFRYSFWVCSTSTFYGSENYQSPHETVTEIQHHGPRDGHELQRKMYSFLVVLVIRRQTLNTANGFCLQWILFASDLAGEALPKNIAIDICIGLLVGRMRDKWERKMIRLV